MWLSIGKSLYYISTQPWFSTTCKYYYKIISLGNGESVACTLRLKYHVHDKLTGLRRVCLGIGSFVCFANHSMSWWGWAKELRILIGSDLTQTWKLSSWVWRNWRCGYGFIPWPPNSQCLPFSSWGQAYRRWFDTHITQEICGRYLGQNAQHRCCSWYLTTLNSLPTSLSFTMELPIDNKIFFIGIEIIKNRTKIDTLDV